MPPKAPFPARFRRRLAIAFVLFAGISAGVLALGAGAAVGSYRHHAFRERSRLDVLSDLRLLASGSPPSVIAGRLENAEEPGGPGVVVVADGETRSSVERLEIDDVPEGLRVAASAQQGQLVEGSAHVGGSPYLVIGVVPDDVEAELYFFFPETDLLESITELRVALGLGWLAVVAAAGIAGHVVARRTLRPVHDAAAAAQSVAEGLLATRLPVDGDDEFGRLAGSFNEMVTALEDKISALAAARDRETRFNADVAHELRTPLGALVTAASMLDGRAGDLPADLRRPVELVVEGARRLHRLADELLELHRLEVGQEDPVLDTIDLADAVRSSVRAHGWDDVRVTADGPVLVDADRIRLEGILVNLVTNGLQHGGGEVDVEVGSDVRCAHVTVRDDGPGIAAEELPHLFDRYHKVSRSRTAPSGQDRASSGGSGLGLAIAAENARLLGGGIAVESRPGQGATFRLTLPRSEGA